jgi:DNA-binding transcriptional MocR family regulator
MSQFLYDQVADQLSGLIQARVLRPGDRLPSVRQLAAQRRVAISTVLQALRQLEDRGLVEARPQSGFFVRSRHLERSEPFAAQALAPPTTVGGTELLMRILIANDQAGALPLGTAHPACSLQAAARMQRASARVGRRRELLLAECACTGYTNPDLARQLVRRSLHWGGPIDGQEIVVTNSCTEALNLCLRAVTKPGDTVALVMLCSSFSKSVSVGLRLGYVVAGARLGQVALLKTLSSGVTDPITQQALADFLEGASFEREIRSARRAYASQIARMADAVSAHFPEETVISSPQGGFVLWAELPGEIDTLALHAQAIASGISFVPGQLFSPSGRYRNCLRLNCGHPWDARFEQAIARLGQLIGAAAPAPH